MKRSTAEKLIPGDKLLLKSEVALGGRGDFERVFVSLGRPGSDRWLETDKGGADCSFYVLHPDTRARLAAAKCADPVPLTAEDAKWLVAGDELHFTLAGEEGPSREFVDFTEDGGVSWLRNGAEDGTCLSYVLVPPATAQAIAERKAAAEMQVGDSAEIVGPSITRSTDSVGMTGTLIEQPDAFPGHWRAYPGTGPRTRWRATARRSASR